MNFLDDIILWYNFSAHDIYDICIVHNNLSCTRVRTCIIIFTAGQFNYLHHGPSAALQVYTARLDDEYIFFNYTLLAGIITSTCVFCIGVCFATQSKQIRIRFLVIVSLKRSIITSYWSYRLLQFTFVLFLSPRSVSGRRTTYAVML